MTEVEKRGIGKAKIGIAVSGILAVTLLMSTIWLGTRVIDLQRQVNTLHTEKSNLQTQVNNRTTQNTDLQIQVTNLTTDKTNLQIQVAKLTLDKNQLQTEVDELLLKLNLGCSEDVLSDHTINQGANSRTLVKIYDCGYAGYLNISLTSSSFMPIRVISAVPSRIPASNIKPIFSALSLIIIFSLYDDISRIT